MIDPTIGREKRAAALGRGEGGFAPVPVRQDDLRTVLSSVNSRIQACQQKLESWRQAEQRWDNASLGVDKVSRVNECQAQLQDILGGYTALQGQALQMEGNYGGTEMLSERLLQLNQQDMNYLEGGCGRLLTELQMAAPASAPPVASPSTADSAIAKAFADMEYEQVINLYGQMTAVPGQIPAGESTLLYGQALLKNYQEPMARDVLSGLLARVRQEPGQESLRARVLRLTADLDFADGARDEARAAYEQLATAGGGDKWAGVQLAAMQSGDLGADEARDYSALLKSYLAYIPKRDGYAVSSQAEKFLSAYPASRLVANVNLMLKGSREQADAWLNRGIQRVADQAGERQDLPPGTPAPGQPAAPGSAPGGNAGGTAVAGGAGAWSGGLAVQEGGLPASQASVQNEALLQEKYDKGASLLADRQYDQAIAVFKDLLATSYRDRAQSRLEEAARLAAQEDRMKAADLFRRASSARDPEGKRKLLLSSRGLLQGVLDKYPQSGLGEKVQRNLDIVDSELRKMDSASGVGAASY